MSEWYTINELADKTGIPDSTIRRYIAKFSDFFVVKGGTRSKRYEDTSVKVLLRIKDLYDKGYETEQTHNALLKDFPRIIDEELTEESSSLPALATADDIAEIKQMLKAQQEFSNRLLDRLAKQEEYIKDSLERRDKALLQSITDSMENRKLLLEDKKEDKTFWQRLFNK